jgi:hypothetical protein
MQPTALAFTPGRPFFEFVTSYLAATIGMGPVFDPANPLRLSKATVAWYSGKLKPAVALDMEQVHQQCLSGALTPNAAVVALSCMLVNTTYEIASSNNDQSPEFEFFRHLRNAASHNNRFRFAAREPSRPAQWAGLTFDHTRRGDLNPLQGATCIGALISPADILSLLGEIETKLP